MALTPGTRLGPYEITGTLGAGGMGEVYRARDARLARDVALKVLPDSVAEDPDRLARFQREAQVLAALKHPNIGAIYGFEEGPAAPGDVRAREAGHYVRALVLELIDGDTLAERIARGPIPVDEALAIAKQIAEALEAAHEQGIIHRDLKPANIKVTPEGVVKVLDFGLAKLTSPPEGGHYVPTRVPNGPNQVPNDRSVRLQPDLTASPTLTSPAMTHLRQGSGGQVTGVGVILGTAAYMAPEQAKGRAADKRSDIWAFGCVLYEMLTGRRPFDGEDLSDTLANVLKTEPNWSALPDDLSPGVRTLVQRCLIKDRRQRVGDVSTILFVLSAPDTPTRSAAAPVASARRTSRWSAIAAASILAAAVTAAAMWMTRPAAPAAKLTRFAFDLPDVQFTTITGRPLVAISPDATQLAFVANDQLYLRRLDELDARPVSGTQLAVSTPVFSPDGQWIAYYAGSALHKIPVTGGAPVTLCAATNPFGMSWTGDTIVFGQGGAGILAVPAAGGDPAVWVKTAPGEVADSPQLLPGGDALMFSVTTTGGNARWDSADVVVMSRATGERKVLLRGGSAPRYVSTGHILYAVGANLMAVPFDLDGLEVTGGPVPVLEGIRRASVPAANTGAANVAIAGDGTLIYVPATSAAAALRNLVWVDRDGREEPIGAPARAYAFPRLSPDGTRVALQTGDAENDIWIWEFARQTLTRLTFDAGTDRNPVWTPDGRRIAFGSTRAGVFNLFWQPADGTGNAERLLESPSQQDPRVFTPDGAAVVYRETTAESGYDLHLLTLPTEPGAKPQTRPLAQSRFIEDGPDFSPDGRWLAYASDESGQGEVYVRPFPNVEAGRWQVSTQGGTHPIWARNGRELFYSTPSGALVVVPVQTEGGFSAGNPRVLFEGTYLLSTAPGGPRQYDVHPDGTRFLRITAGNTQTAVAPHIVVVQNWFEELKRLVPVN